MSTILRTFLLNDDELISAKNSFIGFRVLAKCRDDRDNNESRNSSKFRTILD